jgi:hypothetical protein
MPIAVGRTYFYHVSITWSEKADLRKDEQPVCSAAAAGATLTWGCLGAQHKLDSAVGVELDGLLQIDAV